MISIAENALTIAENVSKIYEAGKQAEYDRFWDEYQQNGNRTDYTNGFGSCWTTETFKPKYDMRPTTAYMMFRYIRLERTDLVEYLDTLGITLNFSNCTNMQYTFSGASISRLGVIDIRAAKGTTSGLFNYSPYIQTIDLLKVAETNTDLKIFDSCSNLKNITIEGVIASNIAFAQSSVLTHDSLMSIINALKDYSGTTTTRTLALHANSKTLLTDAEKAIATEKGWTIV